MRIGGGLTNSLRKVRMCLLTAGGTTEDSSAVNGGRWRLWQLDLSESRGVDAVYSGVGDTVGSTRKGCASVPFE